MAAESSIIEAASGIRPCANVPLAIYVHVPWCVAKCPYCDFNSHVLKGGVPAARYVTAVLADLDFELALLPAAARAISVFFGGGTPSLLAPEWVERLLAGIRARVPLVADAEVTLEANPGTIEHGRFAEYAAAGINRVSLGVQSFDDAKLARLGRIHSACEAVIAAEELRRAGLDNFNLDLMYALPGQDAAGASDDVRKAVALAPAHISWYELTLEPGTAFYRRPPKLPREEEAARIEEAGREELLAAGYERYEISAFARPGRRCRHNDNYWGYGDYIGLGPGAHGKRSKGSAIVRTIRVLSPDRYLREAGSAAALSETRSIPPAERSFEFLLGALRRVKGFRWEEFEDRTGLSRRALAIRLRTASHCENLIAWRAEGPRPTARGLDFLNEVLNRLLPAPNAPNS
ncbi:MAG TPA: radical SAM family heme chaperone HemW [Gammaproteobacteria bacterium]|nr:radical SAM family heme chaperone HemW [Gammaproteobacteria bacterium]